MKLKKGDFLAVALVAALAVGLGLFVAAKADTAGAPVAVVVLDGNVQRRIALDAVAEQEMLVLRGAYETEITVEHGRIRVSGSTCPGGDCVHSGWASSPGKSIVCLPNRLEIRIEGADGDVDATVR